MTKAVVFIGLLFAAAGCDVGAVPLTGGGGPGPDGGGGGGGDGGSGGSGSGGGGSAALSPTTCSNRATVLAVLKDHGGGQGSRKGQACIVPGCHLDVAPPFQVAGTAFKGDLVTGDPGAQIAIFPATGAGQLAGYVDSDGNFYVYKGTIANAFPATVTVSACPLITPMGAQVQANGGGNCNSCHVAGGAAGTVIHLAD